MEETITVKLNLQHLLPNNLVIYLFLCTPAKLLRLENPLFPKNLELVDDGINGELSMHLVVAGADVHGLVGLLFLTND